ncbi:MAG: amidohydrolase [Pseudomonadota bacterium]
MRDEGAFLSVVRTAVVVLAIGFAPSVYADAEIDAEAARITGLADSIWSFAELGYQETRSSALLQAYLRDNGFRVEAGVADIPTAFVASAGRGAPVIDILAEFDALPGLSQAAEPARRILSEGAPGHACGHHMFGAASSGAGVALARWLRNNDRAGTVRVIGTPDEEGGSGKVYLARAGVFDDTDVVLHWHPGDRNNAGAASTNANKSGRFRFKGRAAHAASAPERGRSALDGVEAMNFMVNMMREHVPQESRIHYVITKGGDAPNIVPESAEVYYYVRHAQPDQVVSLFERVVDAARGAAQGTGTTMTFEVMHGNYPVLPNEALARMVHSKMTAIGGYEYDAAELDFARRIYATLLQPGGRIGGQRTVQPFAIGHSMGSTDVGDVSWLVPTVGFSTATWVPGTAAHSWQAVAAGGMSIGHKGTLMAAKVLAAAGKELYANQRLRREARAELLRRRGADFEYAALLGDREPPLDYRK